MNWILYLQCHSIGTRFLGSTEYMISEMVHRYITDIAKLYTNLFFVVTKYVLFLFRCNLCSMGDKLGCNLLFVIIFLLILQLPPVHKALNACEVLFPFYLKVPLCFSDTSTWRSSAIHCSGILVSGCMCDVEQPGLRPSWNVTAGQPPSMKCHFVSQVSTCVLWFGLVITQLFMKMKMKLIDTS